MLGELKGISQHAESPGRRRWFGDEEMDLIVFYDPAGAPESFQLCYDKSGKEGAFTWTRGGKARHSAVDQGEDLPTDNRTPIFASDGVPPTARVLKDFEARSSELEPALRTVVVSALRSIL